MSTQKAIASWAALAILAPLVACGKPAAPSLAESDPPNDTYNYLAETDFYGLVRRVHFNTEPSQSAADLTQQSDVVVLGEVLSVVDGRTFLGSPEDPYSMRTAVARVAVKDVVRGEGGDEIYVAFWRTQVTPIATFQRALPEGELLFFLDPAEEQPDTHNARDGVPEGQTLYELVSPQGLAVAAEDGIVQPLADRGVWLFQDQSSMDELIAALKEVGPAPKAPDPVLTPEQAERNACLAADRVEVTDDGEFAGPDPVCQ